jgi:hypothetical protein
MIRWSVFHVPVYSTAFAMDRQFCRGDMDDGVEKDIAMDRQFCRGDMDDGVEKDIWSINFVEPDLRFVNVGP